MKFEIDDKTGMIEADNQGFDEYWPADAKDLEQLLQAVKKTQKERGIENNLQDFIVYDERDGFLIQSIRRHIDFSYPVDLRKPSPTEIEKFIKHANIAYKKSTNKQIQEIQDSKNHEEKEFINDKINPYFTKVASILARYHDCLIELSMYHHGEHHIDFEYFDAAKQECLTEFKELTGKDIKDL